MIKLPEKTYNMFKNLSRIIGFLVFEKDTLTLIKAVKKGTPLPNRVADADAIIDALKGIEKLHIDDDLRSNILDIVNSNIIVEADKR